MVVSFTTTTLPAAVSPIDTPVAPVNPVPLIVTAAPPNVEPEFG